MLISPDIHQAVWDGIHVRDIIMYMYLQEDTNCIILQAAIILLIWVYMHTPVFMTVYC
jgi:hypothetical protein